MLSDIIGPVMVGPSSSHTAGAAKLGRLARRVWNDEVSKVDIYLRGSFAATYWGHGTDKALVGGLLGFLPHDERIKDALNIARERGMEYRFFAENIDGAHPNSVRFVLYGNDRTMEVVGASLGGGVVELQEIDGFRLSLKGDLAALVTFHVDRPGVVAAVTGLLAKHDVNIATMHLYRQGRGGKAAMVIEIDGDLKQEAKEELQRSHPALMRVIFIPLAEGDLI
ncbi:MAG TPA: L-serine ammonia-lyase, iron-sulfur-dependent subunit beta [Acetomicrobium flavidum]|uniref:L-serine dehydratase n=1 Tax=Acetomicrobium flavidum TaxID=49896 RepID=A0ABY1JCU2_9BACT|nr:L-serine dehydratase [Acetomicrobium flavidum]HOJ83058.1 L-serine ammonia-lyase, iron-sulfur-dependent subunit beta [Acetomicrobium flavidum]HOM31859.1 L-serine ammonia-lyase, iron-sulfur-dependent subunit beta [Acetomicrobium flavidum]HPP15170.1 L-serine ammonia-lyase, iron-sulfur-dependent subunit beta [Acetomicrobium flavidum]